jgi:DNA-binding winged helix-turn-helix (wHTH) protein
MDTRGLTLSREGAEIALRPKAFDTLRFLIQHAGEVVTKDTLVAAVWPDVFVGDDSLAQCVSEVRKALEDEGQDFVRTIPRRGYSFVHLVEPLTASEETGRPRLHLVVVSVFAAAVAVAVFVLLLWRDAAPAPDARFRVAILPFETLESDDQDRWLGDGIAEDILIELPGSARSA